jgi:DNA-binding MarR family transcriptional regulator
LPEPTTRTELLAEVAVEAPRQAAAAVRLSIAIAHQLGMPLTDVQCMGLLEAGPAAPSDLAAQLGMTTGAMTKVLDRLEQSGFVTRSPDPTDRRRIVITADPDGFRVLTPYYAPMAEKMNRYLSGCSDDELRTILDFMRAGRTSADEEIARIREQGIRHATRRRGPTSAPRLEVAQAQFTDGTLNRVAGSPDVRPRRPESGHTALPTGRDA